MMMIEDLRYIFGYILIYIFISTLFFVRLYTYVFKSFRALF